MYPWYINDLFASVDFFFNAYLWVIAQTSILLFWYTGLCPEFPSTRASHEFIGCSYSLKKRKARFAFWQFPAAPLQSQPLSYSTGLWNSLQWHRKDAEGGRMSKSYLPPSSNQGMFCWPPNSCIKGDHNNEATPQSPMLVEDECTAVWIILSHREQMRIRLCPPPV